MRSDSQDSVTVHAPARLHLGFLDPSASLGRRFGSLGLVIDGFTTEVELGPSTSDRVTAVTPEGEAQMERASAYLRTLRARSGRADALHLRLHHVLPAHGGFGSGTQLALAIARAFARWHGIDVGSATLAHWLGRGQRSGIGIHGFDVGGLLVDGGPATDGRPAPMLARVALPSSWRIVVVQDHRQHGLAGSEESGAMAALTAMPPAGAAAICHQVLMQVLPGAANAEFGPFATGVSRIQELLGEHFAPVQGGRPYTSPAVGRLMAWVASSAHRAAIGQSSWGPTGFAVVESPAHAVALEQALRTSGLLEPGVELRVVAARNRGAEIVDSRAQRRTP